MTDAKELAVLVGMNNPYGADPQYALYPLPKRATGHRIWELLCAERSASMSDYRDAFDRRNLQTGPWVDRNVRPRADEMRRELRGRTVLLFGAKVRDAFGMMRTAYGSDNKQHLDNSFSDEPHFTYFHWLPHPSGLNPWYNDADNRRRASRLLARLYDGERGQLAV